MTLTGMKKHVSVLEQAGLVTTEKVGRARTCKLGRRRLEEEAAWIDWSAGVAKLRACTLLVFADADAIRPEHMVEFWTALGGGLHDAGIDGSLRPANQLAIVPNTTHYTLPVEPMLSEIVGGFFGSALKAVG